MPALGDEEGLRLDPALPPVVDAHVHLFPDRVFEALWRWFDTNAWPVRYQLPTPKIIDFLFSRGVSQLVALHYAHKPGMARALNDYIAALCANEPRIIGLATVFPGETGAVTILKDAFAKGLRGVKLHCHVQCFSPDSQALNELYATCAEAHRPMVIHAGREPAGKGYQVDPYTLCAVERLEHVLKNHPTLKVCVPHLGVDEFDGYAKLLERYDSLWLDTTMVAAGYFPFEPPRRLFDIRPDRILYGTDFPNIPYAWDREVKKLVDMRLSDAHEAAVLGQNALSLFSLHEA